MTSILPELHLALNHLAPIGFLFGFLIMLWALYAKSEKIRTVSLGIFFLAGLSALPAYFSGEGAEEAMEHFTEISEALVEAHEESAMPALYAALIAAVLSLTALLWDWKLKKQPKGLILFASIASFTALLLMSRAANMGGQIRHPEIRPVSTGQFTEIDAQQAHELLASGDEDPIQILDVRTPAEYREGHIAGALNLDVQSPHFRTWLMRMNREEPYLIHCKSGRRSAKAFEILKDMGFRHIIHMKSGFLDWQARNLPATLD